jgi:hypothetical protein
MNVAKDQEAGYRAAALGRLLPKRRPQLRLMRSRVKRSQARSLVFDASLVLFVCAFDLSQLFNPRPDGSTGRALMGRSYSLPSRFRSCGDDDCRLRCLVSSPWSASPGS